MSNHESVIAYGMSNSPFAKLPVELRIDIWELVLSDSCISEPLTLLRDTLFERPRNRGGDSKLALLLTCKQISIEARDLVWRNASAVLAPYALSNIALQRSFRVMSYADATYLGPPQAARLPYGGQLHCITRLVVGSRSDSQSNELLKLASQSNYTIDREVRKARRTMEAVMRSLTGLRQLTLMALRAVSRT